MARRHIPLDGNLNLRDLGGYEGAGGRLVRSGCLFRSDELHALTDADLDIVSELGIKVVFDLRHHRERTVRPSRLPPHVEVLERASPPGGDDGRTIEDQIVDGDLPVRDDELLAALYVQLLDRLAPEVSIVVERAADARRRPLLFHCAAGKDRTGLVAAVLLGLLGVSDETILDDYELTSTYYTPGRLRALDGLMTEHGVGEDRIRPLLEARRPVLASALAHLHETWGGFDGYVVDHLAVAAELPDRLRSELLISE